MAGSSLPVTKAPRRGDKRSVGDIPPFGQRLVQFMAGLPQLGLGLQQQFRHFCRVQLLIWGVESFEHRLRRLIRKFRGIHQVPGQGQ